MTLWYNIFKIHIFEKFLNMGILSKIKSLFFGQNNSKDFVPDRNPKPTIKQDEFFTEIQSTKSQFENSNTNESIPSKTDELVGKAKDFVLNTGNEVANQGSALWDAVQEKIEILDEKTQPYRDMAKEKVNEAAEKVKDFVEEKLEKAKELEAEEAKLDANKDGLADKPIDFGKSTIEKHDGFFNKAEEWLKKQEAKEKGESPTLPTTNSNSERLELPKED